MFRFFGLVGKIIKFVIIVIGMAVTWVIKASKGLANEISMFSRNNNISQTELLVIALSIVVLVGAAFFWIRRRRKSDAGRSESEDSNRTDQVTN